MAFFLTPSPSLLRFGLSALRLGRGVLWFRRGSEQPLHDAFNLVRQSGKRVAGVLIFHAGTVA